MVIKLFFITLLLSSSCAFSKDKVNNDWAGEIEGLLYPPLPTYSYSIKYGAWKACNPKYGKQSRSSLCKRSDGRLVSLSFCGKVSKSSKVRRCSPTKKALPYSARWVKVYTPKTVSKSKMFGRYPNGGNLSYAGLYKHATKKVKTCRTEKKNGRCPSGWVIYKKKKWSMVGSNEFKWLKSKGYHVWKGFPTRKQGNMKQGKAYPLPSKYFATVK